MLKKINIGKEQRPLSSMVWDPLKAELWKQGEMFDQLAHIMINIIDTHSNHDIIITVANDNLIDEKSTMV